MNEVDEALIEADACCKSHDGTCWWGTLAKAYRNQVEEVATLRAELDDARKYGKWLWKVCKCPASSARPSWVGEERK